LDLGLFLDGEEFVGELPSLEAIHALWRGGGNVMTTKPSLRNLIKAAIGLGAATLALPLSGGVAMAQGSDISIYFVGCAAPTGFHGYLARGAEEAGKNLGAKVTYIYPDQLTIPNQVQKIEEAIAAKANGIAICAFAEDAAYAEVAARAKEAGIAFGSAARSLGRGTRVCGPYTTPASQAGSRRASS